MSADYTNRDDLVKGHSQTDGNPGENQNSRPGGNPAENRHSQSDSNPAENRDSQPGSNPAENRHSRSGSTSSYESLLQEGERIDDLQRAGLRIIQDPSLFCFGMDAVLLSAFVQIKKARRGLDLGTGNGIIPILLSDRTDCPFLTGLEIQESSVSLARRSVALNGLEDRIDIISGDIREADRIFAAASFDFITCNPPYRRVGSGRINEDSRALARHELLCTFDDVVRAAKILLRPGGHFFLVHRPSRLAELITKLCASGLEPKRMRLVYPSAGKAPNMVLLDCVRGGGSELRVEPPLIVYDEKGDYTPELLHIYYG